MLLDVVDAGEVAAEEGGEEGLGGVGDGVDEDEARGPVEVALVAEEDLRDVGLVGELVGRDVGAAAVGFGEALVAGRGDGVVGEVEGGDVDGVAGGVVGVPVAGDVDAVGALGVDARLVERVPGQVGEQARRAGEVEEGGEGLVVGEEGEGRRGGGADRGDLRGVREACREVEEVDGRHACQDHGCGRSIGTFALSGLFWGGGEASGFLGFGKSMRAQGGMEWLGDHSEYLTRGL